MATPTPPSSSPFNSVFRLFLIPLMIVMVSVGLFYAFGLFTFETKKPEDFLYEIKTGGESKKWQAAYSLAGMLITEKNIPEETRKTFTRELLSLFKQKERYPVKVRSYLALALGYLGQKESVPVLIKALGEPEEDIVLYSVWALAVLGDPAAAGQIISLLTDDRPAIRKISAFALGAFSSGQAIPALKQALRDPVPDVTWNAALSLAKLGDPSGSGVIGELLDRGYLDSFPRISEREKETILLNALMGTEVLHLFDLRPQLEELAKKDSSLKVRQKALEVVKKWNE